MSQLSHAKQPNEFKRTTERSENFVAELCCDEVWFVLYMRSGWNLKRKWKMCQCRPGSWLSKEHDFMHCGSARIGTDRHRRKYWTLNLAWPSKVPQLSFCETHDFTWKHMKTPHVETCENKIGESRWDYWDCRWLTNPLLCKGPTLEEEESRQCQAIFFLLDVPLTDDPRRGRDTMCRTKGNLPRNSVPHVLV